MGAEAGIYLKKNLQRQAHRAKQSKGTRREPQTTGGISRKEGPVGKPSAFPTPLFNKPRPKGVTGKCFGCGQTGHY